MQRTYRAAAIGSTGRGGFGHGLDVVFRDLPGVSFVAIADDNAEGLRAAGQRNRVHHLYGDYRQMLAGEQIDVVSVGMRHTDRHEEVVVACAEAGAHVFCEKPLAPDLAAADRMLAACRRNGVKIAVATQNRASLAVRKALQLVRAGRLGRLLALRGRGKEDHRGGGEDLMVLGFHIMDLIRAFGGEGQWAFAHVRQNGRDMVKSDAHPATEPIGPVAGDAVAAMFGLASGAHAYFESHRGLTHTADRFSLEIVGSEGTISLRSLRDVMWLDRPVYNPAQPADWQPITTPEWETIENKSHWCNRQLVLDLLKAAEEEREPMASGADGRAALEMIQAVYASHLAGRRLSLPLELREHPLS
ncbi:MAG: Gfo/Idh/MocA family protein [Pirellulales bacterium]